MRDIHPAITGLRARGVLVPMARPLHTGGGAVSEAPLVLIDLDTDAGITGHAYLFCYTPLAVAPMVTLLEGLRPLLEGEPSAPRHLRALLTARFRLIGGQGMTGLAMSGIDMAAWDVHARAIGQPLARAIGARIDAVRAYNSNGLGLRDDTAALAREAVELAQGGFRAIKLRLGYSTVAGDLDAIHAVREAVGSALTIMTDYNQCLSTTEAVRRVRALAGNDLEWVEEPVRADDFEGAARVRAASSVPIQLGENAWGPDDVHKSLMAGASDCYMPDAGKVGGVTGWLAAVAEVQAHGLPVSSHLYPEVSVHLLAATPSRHWLEMVDWAAPLLVDPLRVEDGRVRVPERPGIGIEWDEDAVGRYRMSARTR